MTNPKVGLSMLYLLAKPFKKMLKHLDKTETPYVELVDDGLHALNKQRVASLNNIAQSYELKFSVHAPFADINIAAPTKEISRATIKRMEKSIAHASNLNAYVWVFHPGLQTGISMFYPKMDWRQDCNVAKLLFEIADDFGVKAAIENVPEPYPFLMKSVADFKKFYEEVDEDIGLVLDIGHANLNGQIEPFLKTFAERIVHVHAADNNGKSDQHLGIGYGKIDWSRVANLMKKTRYDKVVVVESVEHVRESVQKLKQLFQQ